MLKRSLMVVTVLVCSILNLYGVSFITAAPLPQSGTATPVREEESPAATETPVPEEEPAEESSAEGNETTDTDGEELTLAQVAAETKSLQLQVAELEAIVEALSSPSAEQINQVNTAIYLLDNVGLHGLDVRLNEEGVIESGDSGRVSQIARLLSIVDWPDSLAEDAEALYTYLYDLADALADDDLKAAAPMATVAHEEQHNFSHAAQHWLEGVEVHAGSDEYAQANRVNRAIYLLDNAGLHGLDVRLNEEGVIEANDSGRAGQIARVLSTVDWPESLVEAAQALHTTLFELSEALAEDDLETAAQLATLAHEEQHDFSHDAQHWLESMMDASTHGLTEEGSVDGEQQEEEAGHEESAQEQSAGQ